MQWRLHLLVTLKTRIGGTCNPLFSQSCLILAARFCQLIVFTKKTACEGLLKALFKASLKNTLRVLLRSLLKSRPSGLEVEVMLASLSCDVELVLS